MILILDWQRATRQNIGSHIRMFNEMSHWLNIFYQYKFLIVLDLNDIPWLWFRWRRGDILYITTHLSKLWLGPRIFKGWVVSDYRGIQWMNMLTVQFVHILCLGILTATKTRRIQRCQLSAVLASSRPSTVRLSNLPHQRVHIGEVPVFSELAVFNAIKSELRLGMCFLIYLLAMFRQRGYLFFVLGDNVSLLRVNLLTFLGILPQILLHINTKC